MAWVALAACLWIRSAVPVQAQTTRAEASARKQAEKSKVMAPYTPNKAEQWVNRAERSLFYTSPKGLYPYFESAYTGGSLAAGLGYRGLYRDTGAYDIHGLWSVRNYRMLEAYVKPPALSSVHLASVIHAQYVYADKVQFYGIGNDSSKDAKVHYKYNPTSLELVEAITPAHWFMVGGSLGYTWFEIGRGRSSGTRSIYEAYRPEELPGLVGHPEYLVSSLFVQLDTRQSPGYTTRGSRLQVRWFNYNARTRRDLDFRRVDVAAEHYIPILRANQVFALRALASFTDPQDPGRVPFFLLPTLGGNELRGFDEFRFRDRHRLLLTAEYRWLPSRFLDMTLFYEAGMVAARTQEFRLNRFHDCFGIGARFHTPIAVPLRIDVAHSVEGTQIILSTSGPF